jgi:hypothetical protein
MDKDGKIFDMNCKFIGVADPNEINGMLKN